MIHLNILLIKSFKLSNFLNTFDKINILIFIYLFYSILLFIRHISRFHFSQIIHNEENEEKISQTKQKKKKKHASNAIPLLNQTTKNIPLTHF